MSPRYNSPPLAGCGKRGVQRAEPIWRGSGGVPRYNSPPLAGCGKRGVQRAEPIWLGSGGVPQIQSPPLAGCGKRGVQRAEPIWRGSGGVPQIQFPPFSRLRKKGSPEGRSPFGWGLGVSPGYNFHPFLARKGSRRCSKRVFQQPASAPTSERSGRFANNADSVRYTRQRL